MKPYNIDPSKYHRWVIEKFTDKGKCIEYLWEMLALQTAPTPDLGQFAVTYNNGIWTVCHVRPLVDQLA